MGGWWLHDQVLILGQNILLELAAFSLPFLHLILLLSLFFANIIPFIILMISPSKLICKPWNYVMNDYNNTVPSFQVFAWFPIHLFWILLFILNNLPCQAESYNIMKNINYSQRWEHNFEYNYNWKTRRQRYQSPVFMFDC